VQEIVFQGILVFQKRALGLAEAKLASLVETAGQIIVQDPLHGSPGNPRELANSRMGATLTFEPQNFHPLLNPRMRVLITVPLNDVQIGSAERKGAHDCHVSPQNPFAADKQLDAIYGVWQQAAIVPFSPALSIFNPFVNQTDLIDLPIRD
jgi:hypothetical protein